MVLLQTDRRPTARWLAYVLCCSGRSLSRGITYDDLPQGTYRATPRPFRQASGHIEVERAGSAMIAVGSPDQPSCLDGGYAEPVLSRKPYK